METRCPLCSAPIDLGEAGTDVLKTLSSVECPNCGLVPLNFAKSTIALPQPAGTNTVAHFQLVRKLGRGSFGTVWLANDLNLGRQVALKVAAQDGRDTGALLHEAQSAAKLKHANIVAIYEVGSDESRAYIASEFIDGMNLRDLMTAGRPNTAKAVDLIQAVARALQHAHEQGIVHRDIKPSNIMLNVQGQPFVTDFGLAKRLAADASISGEGAVLGTALYMSPEQADGKTKETDGRSDLYALGITLFEMLTGHVPFRGNVHAVLHQKTHADAPSPRTLNPDVPRDLETICLKCLEREPDKRYRSAQEVADELERFKTGVPIKARPVSALEKAWRWCLRNRRVAGLLLLLFLSLLTGLVGVSFFWRRSVENERLANERFYRAEMNLAAQFLAKGDVNGVQRTLDSFAADGKLAGLRDFAWHYHNAAIAPFLQVSNQGDPVIDVAVFPDGRYYSACGRNRQIRVWDAKSGELVRTLTHETRRFQTLAVSPANNHLASGSTDGLVRIWNPLKDDRLVQQMKHGPPVMLVRYSPDGKRLLSAGRRGPVRIWDVSTGKRLRELPTGMSGTKDVRFSPDGSSIAIATQDGRIRVWNDDPESRPRMLGTSPLVESMAYSDDGKTIVTGNYAGELRVWSVESGSLLYEHRTQLGIIGDLEFLKDTSLLAVPSIGGRLTIFNIHTRREIRHLTTHNLTSGILDRSTDGRVLVVGSGGGNVKLLEAALLTRPDVFWHGPPPRIDAGNDDPTDAEEESARSSGNPVRGVAFLPGGRKVVSATANDGVSVWTTIDGTSHRVVQIDQRERLTAMSADPDGRFVAAAILNDEQRGRKPLGVNSRLELWDLETDKLVHKIEAGSARISALAFSPAGDLALAGGDGRLTVFTSRQWTAPRFEETPRASVVNRLLFSPDGRTLVLACRDGSVAFIDASTGKQQGEVVEMPGVPLSLAYCAGGDLLAVGTETGEIQLLDAADRSRRMTIPAHSSRVNVIAAFPDGRTIVSGGRDRELKLWDTQSGELITTLYGHRRQILSVAISRNGRTIVSGGLQGDVRIWRSEKAQ